MKLTRLITIISAISALACTRVQTDAVPGLVEREFYAQAEPRTKTGLDAARHVVWAASGEMISLVADDGSCYVLNQKSASSDLRTAVFSGLAPESGCSWAIYPAQPEVDIDEGMLTLSIPTVQEAVKNGFADETNLTVSAVDASGTLHFKNVCGIIGFKVNAENVTSIAFSADETSGGALTGTSLVEFEGGAPFCATDTSLGSAQVEIEGEIESGATYYAVVYPGTYNNLKVTFTDKDGRTAEYSKSGTLEVSRSYATVISTFTPSESDWHEEVSGTATLTYEELPNPGDYIKGYGKPATYTNASGTWTICAYHSNSSFQINKDKVAYIGTPVFGGDIKSISITATWSSTIGNYLFCSEPGATTPSGLLQTEKCTAGGITFTADVSALKVRQLYIRADACARITAISVSYGSGSPDPGPGPDPGPDPDPDPTPGPIPDPDSPADYGWFELPAQKDKDGDGRDDDIADYYYSHTFRADATTIRNFSCCYSASRLQPVWVAAPMHSCYKGSSGRNESYKPDPNIHCDQVGKFTPYTRGHLLGSSDRTVSKPTNRQAFYYSNIAAQMQTGFNTGGGAWNNLEDAVDSQWCADTLYQVIGCIFTKFTDKYGSTVEPSTLSTGVNVPTAFFKALLRTKSGNSGKSVDKCTADELKCAAFIIAHRSNAGHKPSASDLYSIEELEALTGLTFFVNVPNAPKGKPTASDWGL